MTRKKTLFVCLSILGVAAVVVLGIFLTEPSAERGGAVRETAMLVEVVRAERGTFRPVIRAMGTVEAARDIVLRPRVQGRIRSVAEGFTPGGRIEQGQVVVRIDPADYENVLAQRQVELQQARTDLALERGRRDVARKDYLLLRDSLAPQDSSLVLREPQLAAARARLEGARAAVDQARLDLARTAVRAPFDAHVLSRDANVGSQVSAGDALGRIVGLETYWVVATVPQATLPWLSFPGDEGGVSTATVRNRTAWEPGEERQGTLHRLVGALDERTRLARVVIEVPDPMARAEDTTGPPLMVGSFVEARLLGDPLEDVIRLNRDHVRDDDTVWVMEDGVLRIRNVHVIFRDADYAYISEGLAAGARVVTTNLATVADGAPLRLEGSGGRDTAGTAADGAGSL